jgi:hypothetical protein
VIGRHALTELQAALEEFVIKARIAVEDPHQLLSKGANRTSTRRSIRSSSARFSVCTAGVCGAPP